MTLGDRIVVMNEGRVQQIDSPMALYERPRNTFVAKFIGSPPMNLIEGTIVDDGGVRFRSGDGALTLAPSPEWTALLAPLAAAGRPVFLGIRPEDIAVVAPSSIVPGTESSLPARVDLVEPTGNEALLYATAASHDVAIRMQRTSASLPSLGAEVALLLDPARAHFFDAASGAEVGGRGKGERPGGRDRLQGAGFRVQVLPRGIDLHAWAVPEP
jgi:multiple sugar transport system ATP-binding protein